MGGLSRHAQVQHQYVAGRAAYGLQRLLAVAAALDDLEVAVAFEQTLQPVQDDGMVVGKNQADAGRHDYKDTTISTREPVSDDSMDILPPSAVTRSNRLRGVLAERSSAR